VDDALAAGDSVRSLAANDGEAYALLSRIGSTAEARRTDLEKAVRLAPSTKNYRALARLDVEEGHYQDAISLYRKALERDPNNMPTLLQLAEAQEKSGADSRDTLQRLIAVEKTPYFDVRAIPELVPTETYEARLKLAKSLSSTEGTVKLEEEAVEGYKKYLETTVPQVVRAAKIDPNANYGGETLEIARANLALAANAATDVARFYRTRDPVKAAELEEDATKFASALDEFK
jgi:tetratricopeptide (TPR) repeat protein